MGSLCMILVLWRFFARDGEWPSLYFWAKKLKVSGQGRKVRRSIQTQYVQILALYWLLRLNQAQKTFPRVNPQFLPLSTQVWQSLLLLVFTVNSVLVSFLISLSTIERESCGQSIGIIKEPDLPICPLFLWRNDYQ